MNRTGNQRYPRQLLSLVAVAWFAVACFGLMAAPVSDIRNTKHNFSASSGNNVRATTNSEVCVFCHTPHGSTAGVPRPLWNRSLSSETYTKYTSSSIDATELQEGENWEVGDSSKLCLSCHDGTLAVGTVTNAPGSGTGSAIAMQGTDNGKIPVGEGADTGYTRRLGVDLSNDHPISFTYNSTLATADGELRNPTAADHIWTRGSGSADPFPVSPPTGVTKTSSIPLDEGNQLECMSCHDPHVRESFGDVGNKFLRLNRFQQTAKPGSSFNPANDIICLACHDKLGATWADSSHADPDIAGEVYKNESVTLDLVSRNPITLREFPSGLKVWQAACLNCHDTHTVSGSRRLLREGTDASGHPKVGGGSGAIEEVCYQCHTTAAKAIITKDSNVPDIETEFSRSRRMPITDADQQKATEIHDIYNADFMECQKTLGSSVDSGPDTSPCSSLANGTNENRHAECTDCHNPHRVTRNSLFNKQGSNTARTHTAGGVNGNVASGALRGSWGVQPYYGTLTTWPQKPSSYVIKQGDPGISTSADRSQTYLTREYQLCFKCHSDFAYADNNEYGSGSKTVANTSAEDTKGQASGRPELGDSGGGTTRGTNYMQVYTNQAAEWAVDATDPASTNRDQGEADGSGINPSAVNHRSWHPVTYPTGRTLSERGITGTNPWASPFNSNTGSLTMHCSDCHGSTSGVQGPHGSDNNFLLKGDWKQTTGESNTGDLCFNCHQQAVYTGSDAGEARTGFCCDESDNIHTYHDGNKASKMNWRCPYCHIAVPHGWKNKAFLVNLNDIGREAGFSSSTSANSTSSGTSSVYINPPYYMGAKLRVSTWRTSGEWTKGSCVSENWMSDSCGGN